MNGFPNFPYINQKNKVSYKNKKKLANAIREN